MGPNVNVFEFPLACVVTHWMTKIRQAADFKAKRFGLDADEGMKFFNGPYNFLYGNDSRSKDRHFKESRVEDDADDGEIPAPRFQMTANKVSELVQIFGPVLYHQNPNRQVNPREVVLPDQELAVAVGSDPGAMMYFQQQLMYVAQQRAIDSQRSKLLQQYLNYTPNALGLKQEARWWVDEAIIKGAGALWTEVYRTPTGQKLVGSFYDSIDNLVIDPDFPTMKAGKFIARRRCQPVWEVERRYGLAPGTLKGSTESLAQQAAVEQHADGDYWRKRGETSDLLTYWEVFSKCGLGGRLSGIDPKYSQELEYYGDYCYLAIADGHLHPLNVPADVYKLPVEQGRQEIARRIGWGTPYWADDEWPVEMLGFHWIPGDPWPQSHIAPGMGELKFLNWAYSLLAGKLRVSCRDFIAILDEAGDDIKNAVLHGTDYEVIRLKASHGKTIDQVVQFLQHPAFNGDIWRVIEAISDQFDRRVGLNELLYGESSRQLRSAAEAEMKSSNVNVRPEDMANRVEDAMTNVARREAMAVRWHLSGKDVTPVLGPFGAMMWDRLITTAKPEELLYSLEYRIEAGSIRKPNRERDAANVKDAMQTLLPFFQQLASAGVVDPFNNLLDLWGKTIDMKVDKLKIMPPPVMAGPTDPSGGGGGPAPAPAAA